MTKVEEFVDWALSYGATVDTIQPDDGSGYTVLELTLPNLVTMEVTVSE